MRIRTLIFSLLTALPAFAASGGVHSPLPEMETILQIGKRAVAARRTDLNAEKAYDFSVELLKKDHMLEGLFLLKIAIDKKYPKALKFCEIVDLYHVDTFPDDKRETIKLNPDADFLPGAPSPEFLTFLHGYYQGYEGGKMKFQAPRLSKSLDELFYHVARYNEVIRIYIEKIKYCPGFKQAIEGSRVLEKLQSIT